MHEDTKTVASTVENTSGMSLIDRPAMPLLGLNRILGRTTDRLVALTPKAIRKRASLTTGLHDFGDAEDPTFAGRLQDCCDAVAGDGRFSAVGRIGIATYYHIHAVNRLRVIDFMNRHPEVEERPVEAPVFIVGYYRTGTTFLHSLLASDPSARAPRAWELFSPGPRSSRPWLDRLLRRTRSAATLFMNRTLVPEQKTAHAIPLDGPEECFFLLENDFSSSTVYNTFQGYDYAFKLLDQDMRPSYRFMKKQLQVMSHGQPDKRWILKSPFHLWHLDALMDVFPDARIVFTHRSITESLPSNCSLSAMTTSKFSNHTDLVELGQFWRRYYRIGMDRAIEQRQKIPRDQMFDLPLRRLARQPVEAMEAMYDQLGMDISAFRPVLQARGKAKKSSGSTKHTYSLAQFGLDEASLNAEFADYQAFVDSLIEPLKSAS
jgi:hypothetical protein